MDENLISIEEATEEEKKRKELNARLSKQEQLSWKIVVGVVIAFLFTLGLIGVEIMLFHTCANKDLLDIQHRYFQEVQNLRAQNFEMELRLQKEINSIKIMNTDRNETKKN